MLSAPRPGHDMIQCQLPLEGLRPAVLAGVLIARQDGAPRQWNQQPMGNSYIVDKPDDQRHIQGQPLRSDLGLGCLYDLGLLLEQQHDGSPQRDNV